MPRALCASTWPDPVTHPENAPAGSRAFTLAAGRAGARHADFYQFPLSVFVALYRFSRQKGEKDATTE